MSAPRARAAQDDRRAPLLDGLHGVDASWRPDEPPDLSGHDTIRFDLETTGLRWWDRDLPVGIAYWLPKAKKGGYLPFAHRAGGNLDEAVVRRWAGRELRGKRLVGLNARFDAHMSRAWGVDLVEQGCTFGDVGHYAALLDDHRKEFSLNAIARDTLGEDVQKLEMPDPGGIANRHAAEVAPYAIRDVELVDLVAIAQAPKLAAAGLGAVRKLEDDVIPVVLEMEKNGAPIDIEKLRRWERETGNILLKTLWKLHRDTGLRVEPDKFDSCLALFKSLGLEPPIDPEEGRPSFAMALLKEPAKKRREIALLLRAKQMTSLRSKYIVKYIKGISDGGILRYALHQLRTDNGEGQAGTVSGRFSATGLSKAPPVGGNPQQVMSADKHKEAFASDDPEFDLSDQFVIREAFVADTKANPDAEWFSADAKQIEYRVFAHLAGSPRILKAYDEDPDADYHDVARDLLVPFAENIRELIAAGNLKRARKLTKNTNFALVFGAGVSKIAAMNDMDGQAAHDFVQAYHGAFPEVKHLIDELMADAKYKGVVKTILGRRSTFPGRERTHKALNCVVQGTAADINKRKLVELWKARKELGITLRLTVHDEVAGDVAHRSLMPKLREFLDRQDFDLKVPILWDAGCGPNWRAS